jgi:hypothetical protein
MAAFSMKKFPCEVQVLAERHKFHAIPSKGNRPVSHQVAYRSRPGRIWDGAEVSSISKNFHPGETFVRSGDES